MELVTRFFKPPTGSFFLLGPRGTGKSLWTGLCFPDALRIDLLEPDIFRLYSGHPEHLREKIEAEPKRNCIVIDEVQKLPDLLAVVHSLMEKKRHLQFVMTGSSARKLKRSGVDLLAGRALMYTFHPFMASELGKKFHLETALQQGMIPVIWSAKDPGAALKAYIGLYLREEIQLEALVRNIGNFSRFLEAISFSHGSVLNLNNVSRECGVERKTVEGYVSILKDTLIAFDLPVFTKKAKREMAAHPKFYLFDTGIFRALRPQGPLDQPQEIDGAALEGLVVQQIRAWNAYRGESNQLSYWRTRSNVEVDLVVYGKDEFWAIEVKNTSRIRPEDLRPLQSFREDYPAAKALFLYRGKERLKRNGILCLPCDDFLKNLHPKKKLESAC